MKRTLVMLVVVGLFLSLCNGAFAAIPSAPFTVDANTAVLYHFDDPQALGLGYDSTSNLDSYGQKLSLGEADVAADLIKPDANGAFGGAASFEGWNVTSENVGNEAWLRKWTDWPSALTTNFSNGLTFEMMLKPDQRGNPNPNPNAAGQVFLGHFGSTVEVWAQYTAGGMSVWTLFRAGFDTYMYSSTKFAYGDWGHFAFTFDKNTGKVANWVNGVDVSNGYYEDRLGGISGAGSPDVTGWNLISSGYSTLCVGNALGYNGTDYVGRSLFSGSIDEARVSNVDRYNAVPEPGSLLALGSGLIGLAGFVIKRRK